ncbi:MAG: prolipoprotein diacylglyceryl transferase [Catenulispora sp. 13_1_20CM_3_70_7]|nr:MAG: prolipoprotein diacylglyceryl transferase [Catenulispora sp. 13_1_20CM_3_70_7]
MPAVIPSPTRGVWHVGPIPVRAYALCILTGILVAVWLTERRWTQRGGRPGAVTDIAMWAVPFGLVGGRLYHVATSWQPYFGHDGDPISALYVWKGGLSVWGAVSLGALGAWIAARRHGIALPPLADAAAPGIALAQGIGRLGNWFNNELYGRATDLPWGLRIHQWNPSAGRAITDPSGKAEVLGTFHPVFLYELLWDFAVAGVVIWADRRWRLGHGRAFGTYVALYAVGRLWIEAMRVDTANHILGQRLNIWTALIVGIAATVATVVSARRRPGREESPMRGGAVAATEAATEGEAGIEAGTEPDAGRAVENAPAHQTTPES